MTSTLTDACGTTTGYNRHRRLDEEPCPACRQARRSYDRWYDQNRRPKAPARELAPCGTISAYERHRTKGEPACEDCRRARREYDRERHLKRQVAKRRGRPVIPAGHVVISHRMLYRLWECARLEVLEELDAELGREIVDFIVEEAAA